LLDAVAASALPHCLQLRPGSDPALSALAVERGMKPAVDVPVMALENSSRLDRLAGTTDDLVINVLPPEEADRHVSVVAAGFEAPEELFVQLMTPSVLSLPGARAYVGYLGYEPVTTAFSVTLGEGVGIFNVATPPAFRRRGYGAAVTARAARDGLRDGAQWAWLQSSPAGYGVYQRLGFRPLESWACWIAGIN
jgi:ribosomal protein S18 acetylase RimI-like enzyme